MSEFTDGVLGRYLDQQRGMCRVLLEDPVQRAQAEYMRGLLDAAERAMASEGVPEDARRRVVNRIVWGEPAGRVDVYEERYRQAMAVAEPLQPLAGQPEGEEHDFQWGKDHVQRCVKCALPHAHWMGGPCPGSDHPLRPGEYV